MARLLAIAQAFGDAASNLQLNGKALRSERGPYLAHAVSPFVVSGANQSSIDAKRSLLAGIEQLKQL
jgi:hypothetical protein